MAESSRGDNRVLLLKLGVIACVMFAFAWALIPLYRVICEVTGINQLVKADAPAPAAVASDSAVTAAPVRLRFDATVQAGLPWQVRPLVGRMAAPRGEFVRVDYEITNASNREVTGQAVPRYLPAAAGNYVKKLECFCFRQQVFKPGETRRFPVVFVIDRAMPAEIGEITLAYSVFDVPGQGTP
ncbi:cytochrome c oxidase assembly protein CtaG/Cox11 [Pseudogulbenkiania sp. NH8B]|uniref:cytochrome c oxidase assembly protein n=1 Tax=Pseudogulbenkiania sp. (strain NH8B) TaxID=748280 RepID=UPI000227A1CD|nr:cytochrome c oxidase assembly protein [Pseudogulbenkiania sp. NH8B]BAK78591.1 cytochrome c oxidase assembly protein CtaG/Cox11 [Pseudogulbenkiania sp. NH8B]